MAEFLEERLSVNVLVGASYNDEYDVEITQTASGSEYRRLVHGFPMRMFSISYAELDQSLWAEILNLYHRAYGMFAGFRVKAIDDYSTNDRTGTPTNLDQSLKTITAGAVYQLQVAYGAGGTPLSIGRPVRTIFKPVAGTTVIAVNGVAATTGWTVNTTTGRVTFSPTIATNSVVTGGCQYDIPCRFNSKIDVNLVDYGVTETGSIDLIELLNP
jgi:uncharacterized protein (TIGR02217 family)